MSTETIQLSVDREGTERGAIATITLNRPDVRNAIGRKMIEEIGGALDELVAAGDVRAVIFTGAGDKAFASGADIAELERRGAKEALERINAALFRRIEELPIPTVAAIRGYALGGGCELAMACDVRVAGRGAKLGQPEVALGILPGAGAVHRLPRLVGLGHAKDLILTGRIIDADEAFRIGLVSRVVPDDGVMKEARAVADAIAAQGALAVRLAKAALNVAGGSSNPYDAIDAIAQAVLFESEDKHQRMTAFLEKRGASSSKKKG